MQDSLAFEFMPLLNTINEEYLISITNKGTVRRALKEFNESSYEIIKMSKSVSIQTSEFNIELTPNPTEFKCSCPSRSICKHAIIGYMYLKEKKREIFGEDFNDEIKINLDENKKNITPKLQDKVFDEKLYLESIKALQFCKSIIYDLIKTGIARCQRATINDLEQSALFCKGGNLISLEKKLRIVIDDVNKFLDKSKHFNSNSYIKILSRIVLDIKSLESKSKDEYITFISNLRSTYARDVSGEFVVVGGEYFSTKSGYDGVTIFLYSKVIKEIFTVTNSRPNIYSGNISRKELWETMAPWKIGGSYRALLSQEIVFKNIKSSIDNKLTTSKDVIISSISKIKGVDVINIIDFKSDFREVKWEFEKIVFSFIKVEQFGELREDKIDGTITLDLYDKNKMKIIIKVTSDEWSKRGIEKIKTYHKRGLSNFIFVKGVHNDFEKSLIPISFFDSGSIINIFE